MRETMARLTSVRAGDIVERQMQVGAATGDALADQGKELGFRFHDREYNL
ncbi:MAG: hypothetical protein WDN06_21675 [Asticcacaulis sp.]